MEYPSMTEGDVLPNKVEINLYMLCPLVLYRIVGKIYCTDVITVDDSGLTGWSVKLYQQLP
jgi:hypothetical protein